MKKIASLLLLPLLLAACGTQNAPQQIAHSSTNGMRGGDGTEYVAAFEAKVQNDLVNLGMAGDLTAQLATLGKSYLNVLKVNESTARAYMKTTYPTAAACTLNWGDGSAPVTITTPSVVATDKADHTYTQSGTYTIRLTCGTDIKTSAFTAIVPVTNRNLFDDFTSDAWSQGQHEEVGIGGNTYSTQGFDFRSSRSYMIRKGTLAPGHIGIILICDGSVRATSGALFDVKTLTGNSFINDMKATAYGADGNIIGSTVFSNEFYYKGMPTETQTLNWRNVKDIRITCHNNNFAYLLIDDMSATIHSPPK